jgi:diguanylate cyclase (GGDEF)-like protein/PAS domain S-box-containing protein
MLATQLAEEAGILALVKRTLLKPEIARGLSHARPAVLVFVLGVTVSSVAWLQIHQQITAETERKFNLDAAQAAETIDRRVQANIDRLRGLRGLFLASGRVTRREFQVYLSGLGDQWSSSGLRAVSFGRRVKRDEKQDFERQVRADTSVDPAGYPNFTVRPPGDRNEYVVVEYIDPIAGNEAALGLDLFHEPIRRSEIALARDTGKPVVSAPFAASVDPSQISFAVRMAIYRPDLPLETVAQRRVAFEGIIAAVIHARELMENALRKQIGQDFELVARDLGFPGVKESGMPFVAHLLYASRRHPTGEQAAAIETGLEYVIPVDVAGRKWQLSFSVPRAPYSAEQALPLVVFLGGLVTSLLLSWLVWTLTVSRERALKLAEQATTVRAAEGLREQLRFVQQLIESVPQPIFFKDAAERRYLGVNQAWERFFGIPREKFVGKTVFELYPHNPELASRHHAKDGELFSRPGSQSYEAAIVAADGTVHHTIYNKATFTSADGKVAGLIGAIADITSLKEAEAALRDSEGRFRDLTELSSDWYWEQDAEFRITQVSSKLEEFNLDPAEDIGKRRREFSRLAVPEDHWQPHEADLEAHRPFTDFEYDRYDLNGNLRTISISGRPIFGEDGRFRGYRGTGRDITEQKQTEARIRHMAHYDTLTDLPNRALLHDRIGQGVVQAKRSGRPIALLFIDLDRFKNVNDSLGHAVGDRLLRAVAERIKACTRSTDTVSRLGGDEFVVVLTDLAQSADCSVVAQKILTSVSQVHEIDGRHLHVTPSIGICAYPQDGQDVETLMRNADAAMYHAKEMGRNNFQFFTKEMNTAAHQRLALESDLRSALERGEFVLHYQPQLDLRTGKIVGVEALTRWRHPQRGLVGPANFVAAAEENGLINPIGEWALREACRQVAEWRRMGHANLQVAVNFSPQQFRRSDLAEMVARTLEQEQLPAGSLEIEITENFIIQHAEQTVDRLAALSQIGVQLSIDDFGTGYSSLSYLKRFPIDNLKIDQSFVRDITTDPDDAAIITAIVAMAHSLALVVIAEGVETAEQLAFLKRLGCDRAQGYYFSRPLPAAELAQLLESRIPV